VTPEQWHRVKEVFEAALGHAPEERSAFLGQACGADDLLRSEVKSLLSSYEQETRFMETPAAALAAQSLVKEESAALVGKQLGHYQIVRELGRGGMGVVYLAQDTSLGRSVALKLLPSHLTSDPERLRRFEREARAASALNHPNILTIHEIGHTDGLHFIETEFIDGITLREQIRIEELKLGEALNIAAQIASALAAAHEAGIVHRDIKPENVMLRRDGYVKVLDFGLAKLIGQQAVAVNAESAARAGVLTDTAAVIGTVGYMSPEQARGLAVDARTDIWSLGVVLYEMVTKRAPFKGETPSHVIVSILEQEPPPLTDYLPELPVRLQEIISKALCKNREERYPAVKDLLMDLTSLRQQQDFDASIQAVARTSRSGVRTTSNAKYLVTSIKRHRTGAALALVALVVAVLAGFYYVPRTHQASQIGNQPPSLSRLTFDQGLQYNPTFSPDGRFLAFVSNRSGNSDIWVQLIGSGDPIQITHSPADDVFPDWSPDGNSIVFRSEQEGGGLFVVPAFGGHERKISSFGYAPRWSPDGSRILFSASDPSVPASKLFLATPDGSAPREVLLPDFDSTEFRGFAGVHWHPDGQRISFYGAHRTLGFGFWIVPLNGGTPVKAEVAPDVRKRLNEGRITLSNPHWAPSGKALYCEGFSKGTQNLWKVTVDPQSLRWIAGPERLTTGGAGEWDMRISRDGKRMAYVISTETTRIWSFPFNPRTGQIQGDGQPLTAAGIIPENPDLSPDGKKLLFVATQLGTQNRQLIEKSLDDGRETVLVPSSNIPLFPRWSRDSTHIVYRRRFPANPEGTEFDTRIVMAPAAGGDEQVLNSEADEVGTDWSADGQTILAMSARGSPQHYFLCLLPLSAAPHAETEMRVIASHPEYNLFYSRFSPDDRWIAFNAVRGTDLSTIFVAPVSGGEWTRITEEKGWSDKPNWSPDGRILYLVSDRVTGYLNVWGIHFDPVSGKPVGEPFQITSYKSESKMLWQERSLMNISVSEHRLVLPISEVEGSIWMLENMDHEK
jgi:serine/threonine protein kinase